MMVRACPLVCMCCLLVASATSEFGANLDCQSEQDGTVLLQQATIKISGNAVEDAEAVDVGDEHVDKSALWGNTRQEKMQNDNEEDEEQAEDDADDEEKDEESASEENDEGNEEDEGSLMSDDDDHVDSSGLEVTRTPREESALVAAIQANDLRCRDHKSRRRSGKSCQVLAGLKKGAVSRGKLNNVCRSNVSVVRLGGNLGREARETCCKTCQTAPMQVVFGGDQRGAGGEINGRMTLPEDIRAQQCTLDKCQECGSQDNCFQTVLAKPPGQRGNHVRPYAKLSVQKGLPFTSYRASFYAKCDAGDLAKVRVMITDIQNGIVQILMDGIYKARIDKRGGFYRQALKTNGDPFQLSVEFLPTNTKAPSKVLVQALLGNVLPKFERCMDHKTCLTVMGNMKLRASYALRNKNAYQLSCLMGATLPPLPGLKDTCEAWRSCVEENPSLAKYLKTSLSAANPSMLQVETTAVTKAHRQEDECLDPAIADAEALECECMDRLQEKCGEDEECFKSTYCEHDRVCRDWKVANGCPQSLLQAESDSAKAHMALAAKRRSLHNESSSSAHLLTDNLESATQGKCAE